MRHEPQAGNSDCVTSLFDCDKMPYPKNLFHSLHRINRYVKSSTLHKLTTYPIANDFPLSVVVVVLQQFRLVRGQVHGRLEIHNKHTELVKLYRASHTPHGI